MIETVIPYRSRSIGSMDVKRILPYSKRRAVGPFVFVDEMGPVEIVQNQSLDVLSHPHIGLATVTYLFSGKLTHRDSLGTVQVIEPGEVNLMSADNRLNCFVLFAQSAFCCFDTNPGFALKKYFKSSHFRFKVA